MKTTPQYGWIALVAILFIFASCEKSKLNRATTSSEDNELAENMFNDVFKVVEETAQEEDLEGEGKTERMERSFGSCATVTIDPPLPDQTFPKTITIDFGTSGCTGDDGRVRTGKIVAVMSGLYREEGTVIDVTPDNYTVNGYSVNGSKTITNNGRNGSGNLSYSVNVSNAKIISPDGDEVSWNSTRTREWIEGEETNFWTDGLSGILDDVYLITGNASGTNRDGRAFTVTITKALRAQLDCRWITSGTIELEPDKLKKRTIDFGNGGCDNEATVEISDKSYTIRMR